MYAILDISDQKYKADLSRPIDISIPLKNEVGPNCFYAPDYKSFPVEAEGFIGSTKAGGIINFFNIHVNPHGNGTHTECVGHISKDAESINDCLKQFHFSAIVVSIMPTIMEDGDRVIMPASFEPFRQKIKDVDAIIIRTFPNDDDKLIRNYSGSNPPYVHHTTMELLNELGIRHLLIDLPSVDREKDGARFLAHRAFWKYPDHTDRSKTITELIYVNNDVQDGLYLLNIQIGNYELDASPSKITIYPLL